MTITERAIISLDDKPALAPGTIVRHQSRNTGFCLVMHDDGAVATLVGMTAIFTEASADVQRDVTSQSIVGWRTHALPELSNANLRFLRGRVEYAKDTLATQIREAEVGVISAETELAEWKARVRDTAAEAAEQSGYETSVSELLMKIGLEPLPEQVTLDLTALVTWVVPQSEVTNLRGRLSYGNPFRYAMNEDVTIGFKRRLDDLSWQNKGERGECVCGQVDIGTLQEAVTIYGGSWTDVSQFPVTGFEDLRCSQSNCPNG